MKKTFYILLAVLIFISGCNKEKDFNPLLLEIKDLIQTQPDSALLELDKLYPGNNLTEHNLHYYYLLLTEARYKNGIFLIESNSLINLSINYFMHNKYPELHAESYLWKGRVWNELEKPHQAIKTFLKGIDLLEGRDKNSKILSQLYDDLGNIYSYEYLFEDALEVFRKKYELNKKYGDNRDITFSLRNIGNVYDFMEKADSLLYYYEAALEYAKQSDDSTYLSDILYNDISMWYKQNEEYNKALFQHEKIIHPTDNMKLNKASLLINLNQLDPASDILNSITYSRDINVRAISNNYLSLIEKQKGNYKKAYDYHRTYKSQSDSIYELKREVRLKAISHFYSVEKKSERLKNQHSQLIIAIFSFVIIIFVVSISISIILENKRELKKVEREKHTMQLKNNLLFKEKENDELNSQIIKLQTETLRLKGRYMDNDTKTNKIIRQKESEIQMLQFEMDIRRFREKPVYETLKQMENDKNLTLNTNQSDEIQKEIKLSFPDYINQIKKEFPQIKDKDIVIFCLKKSNFSSTTIGRVFNLTAEAIRKRLSRLNQK